MSAWNAWLSRIISPFSGAGKPPSSIAIRAATKTDLDDITRIAQAAFPDDPEFNYRFPYRNKYPEDNWKWTRLEYEEYLDQPEKYGTLIATAPVQSENQVSHRAIALAVWDLSVCTKSKGGGKA